jgi:hypothetical protein
MQKRLNGKAVPSPHKSKKAGSSPPIPSPQPLDEKALRQVAGGVSVCGSPKGGW